MLATLDRDEKQPDRKSRLAFLSDLPWIRLLNSPNLPSGGRLRTVENFNAALIRQVPTYETLGHLLKPEILFPYFLS